MRRPPSIAPAPAVNLPVLAEAAALGELTPASGLLARAWKWIRSRQLARNGGRRLQVAETVSLGEKRFVAVVQVDGRHFLLAGGPTNIALLAQLDDKEPFDKVLKKTMTVPEKSVRRSKGRSAPAVKKKKAVRKPRSEASVQAPAQKTSAFAEVLSKKIAEVAKHPSKRRRPAKATPAKAPFHGGIGNKATALDDWEIEETNEAGPRPPARPPINITLEDYA